MANVTNFSAMDKKGGARARFKKPRETKFASLAKKIARGKGKRAKTRN